MALPNILRFYCQDLDCKADTVSTPPLFPVIDNCKCCPGSASPYSLHVAVDSTPSPGQSISPLLSARTGVQPASDNRTTLCDSCLTGEQKGCRQLRSIYPSCGLRDTIPPIPLPFLISERQYRLRLNIIFGRECKTLAHCEYSSCRCT